jgi:hypothetical protein
MKDLELLLAGPAEAWVNQGLESYQQKICWELLADNTDPMRAAETWLTVSPTDTSPFGATSSTRIFLDRVIEEIEKLLCGDPAYEKERKKIISSSKSAHSYFVAAISVAIAPTLGSSAVFLAPVVALILLSMGKCSLAAWCRTRIEKRETS